MYALAHHDWLAALVVVVLIAALAAVTGIKPKGMRHLAAPACWVARLALLPLLILLAYLAFRSRSGA